MPPLPPKEWTRDKRTLCDLGVARATRFCLLNGLEMPPVVVTPKKEWHVNACAYYRPDTEGNREWTSPGINICVEHCGRPADDSPGRNWSWPGSTTDRTPYGVVCHELGHHCDWLASDKRGTYFGDFGVSVMARSGEAPLTSYAATNPAEWFAEAMRLFVINPDLLRLLRPKTYGIISLRFKPIRGRDWINALGSNVPARVVKSLRNKGAR
jgi:hypothetical protein